MSWWLLAVVGNGLVAVSYLAIAVAIVRPLVRSGQIRSNKLGMATGAIFFSCSIGHGLHALHPLLPLFGIATAEGLAARRAILWHDAGWDLLTAAVGVYYWSLRRSFAPLLRGAAMFEDLRQRERITELETNAALAAAREEKAMAIAQLEANYSLAFNQAPLGIALISLEPQTLGQFLRVNPAFCQLMGRTVEGLIGSDIRALTLPEDQPAAERGLAGMLAGERTHYAETRRYLHADGHVLWTSVSTTVVTEPERPRYVVAQFEDITARREAELRLSHQALHDGLTGLPNRLLLLDRIDHALARAHRLNSRLAVLFLDIDRFKSVNDTLGHSAGDALLIEVASRLTHIAREDDTVARLGGDEFVVLCENVPNGNDAGILAQRILHGLSLPCRVGDEELTVSASIGVAVSGQGSTSAELLRDADTAMYRAKDSGRGRYVSYDAQLRTQLDHRLRIEKELRWAIEDDQLRVLFQPVVNLASGGVESVEALVRWRHPTRGLLAPGEFLPYAESSGLIVPLGQWMLREGCRQFAEWQRNDPKGAPAQVAINVSAAELADGAVVATVQQSLALAGLPAEALCLEITESALLEASTATSAILRDLKDLSVTIALDDFGTGYSSLTHLRRFPVDIVKIDRSFVTGLPSDPDDNAIVQAVVGLANALGLTTVAEGVEHEHQRDHLRRLGCTSAQGYLYSPPATVEELTDLIRTRLQRA